MNIKLFAISMLLLSKASFALGPLDISIMPYWWASDLQIADINDNAGNIGIKSDIWLDNDWGLAGNYSQTAADINDLDDISYLNLDVHKRVLSFTDNTYVSSFVGLQQLDSDQYGNIGPRFGAKGQVGFLGIAATYGQFAWMPMLGDGDVYDDVDAKEYEVGFVLNPLPFIDLSLGYRRFESNYNNNGSEAVDTNEGIMLGIGAHL